MTKSINSSTVSLVDEFSTLANIGKAVWVEGHRISVDEWTFAQWKVWLNENGQDIWVIFEVRDGWLPSDNDIFWSSELGSLRRYQAVSEFKKVEAAWKAENRKFKFSIIACEVAFSGLTSRPKTHPTESEWELIKVVKSDSDSSKEYHVSRNKVTDRWSCTCPGHTQGRCIYVEYCKHIRKVKSEFVEYN